MVWQKIDDQFGISRKVVRIPHVRRQQCIGLWVLALNYAGRSLTDGVIEGHELTELRARAGDVAELVRVGLWHGPDDVCDSDKCPGGAPEGGATIHDFWEYNPTKAQVLERREAERVRKASQRDKGRKADGTPGGVRGVSEHPVPVPDPVPEKKTDLTHLLPVSPDPTAQAELDDPEFMVAVSDVGIRDLPRVMRALERVVGAVAPAIAVDTARAVILLATKPVRSVEAYVEAACVNSPEQVTAEWRRVFDASPKAAA